MLQSMGSQRIRHDWVTEQQQQNLDIKAGIQLLKQGKRIDGATEVQ